MPEDRNYLRSKYAASQHRKAIRIPRSHREYRRWKLLADRWVQPDSYSCAAVAWGNHSVYSEDAIHLRPEGIYQFATCIDTFRGEGTSIGAVAHALKVLGVLKDYRWFRTLASIRNYVLDRGPVVFASSWFSSMNEVPENGILKVSGQVEDPHAFLICGYSRKTRLFRVLNGWDEWGVSGEAFIRDADMRRLFKLDGEACTGFYDK